MPKIRKNVQGYGMTGNNFVSYLFGSSLLYFLGPMACWTTVATVTQVQKAEMCFRVSWRKIGLGPCQ